jgi:hypothetical protein
MNLSTLNWPAIIVAALSAFVLGGLWYSLFFQKAWMRANGFTKDSPKGNMGKTFTLSFLWSLVMSFNLAMYLNASGTDLAWGAEAGFLAGVGWVAMAIFITGLFERRSTTYMLINAGYFIVALTLMGAILGAWR